MYTSNSCLQIRVLPSVVLFVDGVAVERIVGFEGLSDKMPTGKEDEWTTNMVIQIYVYVTPSHYVGLIVGPIVSFKAYVNSFQ